MDDIVQLIVYGIVIMLVLYVVMGLLPYLVAGLAMVGACYLYLNYNK